MKKYVLIFSFFITLFLSVFISSDKIKIPYFNRLYKDVIVDIIFDKISPDVYFDNNKITSTIKIDENHYQYIKLNNKAVKEIEIKNNSDVKQIIVFNGNDSLFIDKNQNIIKINNNKNILDRLSIIFLSFFYNFYFYIIPYIILFIYFKHYKIHISYKKIFFLILFLALFLRCTQINYIPFWDDEMYTLGHSAPYSRIIDLFNDPGNPPLHFILFKIYRTIFKNPELYRYSSVIFGIIFVLIFYNYCRFWLGRKKALFGMFFASVSLVLIYFSQEIRCYMLLMVLSCLSSLYLFKFNKKKNNIIYFLSALAILYTHFYGAFIFLYNFIFGILSFKNRTKLKNFIFINLILSCCYIPLIIYKFSSITTKFNSWIVKPVLIDFIRTFSIFINPVIWFILFCIFIFICYFKTNSKSTRLLIKYNFVGIFFVIFTSALFSDLIKPIFLYRYFYVVFPYYLLLSTFLITKKYNFHLGYVFQFITFIILITKSELNYQNLFCNHNIYLDFIKHNLDSSKNNYIFVSDTIQSYKEINKAFKNKAQIIYMPVNNGINVLYPEDYNLKKPNNIYVLNIYLSDKTYKEAKNIELYKTPLGVFCKIEN